MGQGADGDAMTLGLLRRLVRESCMAVEMLEAALAALWELDVDAAERVRRSDDEIDAEEVEIERQCLEVLSHETVSEEAFRRTAFVLKVNADVERVADHANSIAKIVQQMASMRPEGAPSPRWPTSLVELGQRVPAMCHALLRAVLDADGRAALAILRTDKTIDQLDRRLFEETVASISSGDDVQAAEGLLIHRVGRELERVGDLMKSIAEDLIYRETGCIVRHAGRAAKAAAVDDLEASRRTGGAA